jgi:hypothetical protein
MQDRRQAIQNRIASELARMAGLGAMLKGTVSQLRLGQRKRGGGERVAYLLTYKGKGNKTKSVYVPADRVPEVKDMIGNHRQATGILDTIVKLSVDLFKMK